MPAVARTPRSYVAYGAQVSATERFAPWRADPYAYGAGLDEEQARGAAIGEAVERYCGNAVPNELTMASFTQLRARGIPAVDPLELALYSPQQHQQRGFPFVPLTRDLEIAWAPASDLMSSEPTLVPASLVYLNYFSGAHAHEPRTNHLVFAGIAAGTSTERAQRSALEELFERDATTLWWLSGGPASGLDVSLDPDIGPVIVDSDAQEMEFTFLQIPSAFPGAVVGAFVEDRADALVAFGTACRASPAAAAAKALGEALQLRSLSVELLDPGSAHWQAVRYGTLEARRFRPYRPDRSYRAAFRADYRDMTDLAHHVQFYLDPRAQTDLLERLRTPLTAIGLGDAPAVKSDDPLGRYLAALTDCGFRAYAIDLTTRDVREAGLRVARVVVPGLYSNAPAAFPLLGGRRLEEALRERSRTGRDGEDIPVRYPLPYG
jgi:ribosomal protein S12 methylthiotransferase accessory factor